MRLGIRPILLYVATTTIALTFSTVPLAAQEPETRADSLEQILRILIARIDSLQSVLDSLVSQGRDTTEVVDELAALRAAARAKVPEAADTVPDKFVIQSRNLNDFNPEISVTGDVRLTANRPGPQVNNVDLREFEFGFQAALDPYSVAKVFFSLGEDAFGLEEAYVYWTGLPGGIRLDLGRFRQQAGELNRWHLHSLPQSEYPLVIREYLGPDGLSGNGLSFYSTLPFQSPGGGVHELWAQPTVGKNPVLFDNGNRMSILGHLNNFWQLSRSTYFQLGATGLYGQNPDTNLVTTVLGANLRFTWRPPERSLYKSFTIRGEGFAIKKKYGGVGDTKFGWYVESSYQISRRLHFSGRLDYVEPLETLNGHNWQTVVNSTFWQSDWVFIRAEWQHLSVPSLSMGRATSDLFVLQVVWSLGPHKHESY